MPLMRRNNNTLVCCFDFQCVCMVEQIIDDLEFPTFSDMEGVPLPQKFHKIIRMWETYLIPGN
jgi:hypothetical protein